MADRHPFIQIYRRQDMKIYTRTGDQGSTTLYGNVRVSKCDLRISACGSIDELNALLGLARAEGLPSRCAEVVRRLQNQLFELGAELATPDPVALGTAMLQPEDIGQQETIIDELEQHLPPLTAFILPGGCKAAAELHLARCVCRRAEREIVALGQTTNLREIVLEFVNRTSDLLFVLARTANLSAGIAAVPWMKSRSEG